MLMDGMVGEIRAFCFKYNPLYWLPCDGTQYQIQQYPALYAVIGPRFGGDSKNYFNVPDLRGVVPFGAQYANAPVNKGGEEVVSLSLAQLPTHQHSLNAVVRTTANAGLATNTPSSQTALSNAGQVGTTPVNIAAYSSASPTVAMSLLSIGYFGTTNPLPHENRMPYLPMTYCICYEGSFMPRP